jgi:hypothetical protein
MATPVSPTNAGPSGRLLLRTCPLGSPVPRADIQAYQICEEMLHRSGQG